MTSWKPPEQRKKDQYPTTPSLKGVGTLTQDRRAPIDINRVLENCAWIMGMEVKRLYKKTYDHEPLTWEDTQQLVSYLKALATAKPMVDEAVKQMLGFNLQDMSNEELQKYIAEEIKSNDFKDDKEDE